MSFLDLFFNPRSIVLIGAAHSEMKLGGVILKNLLKFRGKVFPVNPKYPELMGLKTYPSAADIPEVADLAIILRPAPEVPEILKGLEGRTKGVIVISSGFAEVGKAELQNELRNIGRQIGVRILGPNCMGVFNPYRKLDTSFLPYERLKRPGKGNVAVLSQSGAILSCLLSVLEASRVGASKAVGYGNAMDVNEADIYDYLGEDGKTDVVVSYIESVGDGRKFIESARRLSEKKPLIILKAGKGESGQAAAFSHTGRLAGKYEVFHSILKQFGVREVMDFDELMDATKALSFQRPAKFSSAAGAGNRVFIITNGGGCGVLAADECVRQGLEVTKLPDEKRERLIGIFPNFYGVHNPLDVTAQVRNEDYGTALNELIDDYDGFLVIALPNIFGITEDLASLMKDFKEKAKKPVVFYLAHSGISRRLGALLEKAKIPVYPSAERAVRGLKALLEQQSGS